MPALTITAVDHTTGQLTIPAHGLNTGDGPADVYTASGTLPTGLAPLTDYWVIVIDANTLKLASSSTNAAAGTAVAFTDNGAGAMQLLLGLPYCRPRTYAPGVQVKSADLNSNADTWKALWAFLTGQPQTTFPHRIKVQNLPAKAGATNGNAVADGTVTPSATPFYLAIPLEVGELEVSWAVTYDRAASGGGVLSVSLVKIDATGTTSTVNTFGDSTNTGWRTSAIQTVNLTVNAGDFLEFKVTNAIGSSPVSGVAVAVQPS